MRVEGHPYAIDKVIQEPNWDTIDMVKHDGHLYSSKPPLLPTLMAGEYWLIHRLTGATLGTHPYAIGRFMLVTINVMPLVIYFLLLARLVERFGTTDWGRMFVMAAAAFGTFLTTFAVTLNNHLPAAVCAMVALYAAVRIWFDGERRWRYFVVAGLFGALTAANELPALSLLGRAGAGVAVEGAAADARWASCPARARGGGRVLRHELDRPRQPRAGLPAPQRGATTGTTTPTSATAARSRAIGAIRRASIAASRRRRSMRCTCWSAITASSRSRRSGC